MLRATDMNIELLQTFSRNIRTMS